MSNDNNSKFQEILSICGVPFASDYAWNNGNVELHGISVQGTVRPCSNLYTAISRMWDYIVNQ